MQKKPDNNSSLREYIYSLPKTEIHLHLEGLASVETIWSMIQKYTIEYPDIKNIADLKKKFQISSLDEFIDLFINVIQNVFRKEEDLLALVNDAEAYLKRNNVFYAEIFFAPSKFVQNGLSFKKMIEILADGAKALSAKTGIEIRYLIDVSRSYGIDNAENNLALTLANPNPYVIGIGLGGAEARGPAKDYKTVFNKAAAAGLKIVAHAGEDVGPYSIWDAIDVLKAARIGHGLSAAEDEKLMGVLKKRNIPLEICPTSNVFTRKYVKNYHEHPVKMFYDKGLCTTINSDDPTLFGSELIDEYELIVKHGLFKSTEIAGLIKNNLFSTFMPEKDKKAWWKKIQAVEAEKHSLIE